MKIETKRLALIAILTALTVVLALTFIFPVPMTNGYVNFLEVGIYTTAMLLGGPAAFFVGAISGGLLDLILGYPQWIIFSVIIHGVQGYIAGMGYKNKDNKIRLVSLLLASAFMVVGYFLATSFLYTLPAGIASIVGNIVQNTFGIIVAFGVVNLLQKSRVDKIIKKNKNN